MREFLAVPAESVRLDFKERLDWADTAHKFSICRDIAGLANRSGGHLIVGVAELAGAGFRLAGMAADDPLPDPTDVNQVLRERFDPAISCEVAYVEVDGLRYGVIEVLEFATYPHICSRDASAGGPVILRTGDLYVRTDAFSTERARPADVRRIIESAVGKTGAAIARLVEPRPGEVSAQRDQPDRAAFTRYPTRRALRLTPLADPEPVRLSVLERQLLESRVTQRGYALVPRYMDPGLEGTLVVREVDRVIFEIERTDSADQTTMSVVEATRSLRVRIWESLWEDTSPDLGGDKVNVTSIFGFAYAGVLFAWRFYSASGVGRFQLGLGLTSPLGRALTIDPARFTGFFRSYRATSASDLWVSRDLQTASLTLQADRANVAQDLASELLEYWGWHANDDQIIRQLAAARQNLDDDPDPPP